jgi:polysaccharide export outer membrane protein
LAGFQLHMVSEIMRKSPAQLILFSLCLQCTIMSAALAQDGKTTAPPAGAAANGPAAAYVPATVSPYTNDVPASNAATGNANAPSSATSNDINSTNYILGPEDTITVRVFAADDIPDRPAQIANDGTVTLPMVGQVHAAGLTVDQFQIALVTAYKKYFKDPQVTVQVTDFRSQPVSVAGNVNAPGVVQLRGNRNLMEVIGQAGGLRADAGDSVLITRNLNEGAIPVAGAFTDPTGKYSVAHINIREIMSGKNPQGNVEIKPHDVITVPRARMVYVLGNVNRPGGYVMTENETMSLTQAVALAGGWNTTASLKGARVLRSSGGGEREQIPADVKRIVENKAPDLEMHPDDILYIPNSFGKAMSARGLDAAIGTAAAFAVYH